MQHKKIHWLPWSFQLSWSEWLLLLSKNNKTIASEQITAIKNLNSAAEHLTQQQQQHQHTWDTRRDEERKKKRFGVILTALTKRTKHPAPSGEYIRQRSKTQPVLHKRLLSSFSGIPLSITDWAAFIRLILEQNHNQESTEWRDWTFAERPKCVCRIDPQQKGATSFGVENRSGWESMLIYLMFFYLPTPRPKVVFSPLFYLCCTQRSAEAFIMDTALLNLPMTQPHCLSSPQE